MLQGEPTLQTFVEFRDDLVFLPVQCEVLESFAFFCRAADVASLICNNATLHACFDVLLADASVSDPVCHPIGHMVLKPPPPTHTQSPAPEAAPCS